MEARKAEAMGCQWPAEWKMSVSTAKTSQSKSPYGASLRECFAATTRAEPRCLGDSDCCFFIRRNESSCSCTSPQIH
ncbi:hypothetical protein CEXT_592661 [Caerostris extrusa]|uniref:Uncharacterized protein n=1 Tax=Caerostris extrusa TaxID=172846 RepID=A0AAV4Y7S7_CAEEX|nr:hypothetical protein CEXT_592661 [Caerostris extrusa]